MKKYGEYPGSLTKLDEIEKLNELELFLEINSLQYCILQYKRLNAYNMSKGIDIKEDEYALEYLIGKTQKFGVILKKDETGRMSSSEDYLSWYQYHVTNINEVLEKEEFKKLLKLKSLGYDITICLPNSSYLDHKRDLILEEINNPKIKMPV